MGQSAEEVREDIERVRGDLGDTLDAIGDRVSPRRMVQRRTGRVRDRFTSLRETVMGSAEYGRAAITDRAGGLTSSGKDGAHALTDRLGSAASTVGEQASEAPQIVRRQTQGNPIAAGLVAFGGGLLLASILPATEPERQVGQALKERAEPLKEQAQAAAQEMKDSLQDTARGAAEHVMERAQEATSEIKQEAKGTTDSVKDKASQSAEEVKQTASGSS